MDFTLKKMEEWKNYTEKYYAQQRFAKIGVLVLNLHIVLYFYGK